jgi:hypothetical protein
VHGWHHKKHQYDSSTNKSWRYFHTRGWVMAHESLNHLFKDLSHTSSHVNNRLWVLINSDHWGHRVPSQLTDMGFWLHIAVHVDEVLDFSLISCSVFMRLILACSLPLAVGIFTTKLQLWTCQKPAQ